MIEILWKIESKISSLNKENSNKDELEKNIKNTYKCIEGNEKYLNKLAESILNFKSFIGKKDKEILNKTFENIEDGVTSYACFFSVFLLNSFNMIKNENSDLIINEIEKSFNKLSMWLKIFNNLDPNIKINRKLIFKTLRFLLNNKLINEENSFTGNKTIKYISLKNNIFFNQTNVFFQKFQIKTINKSSIIFTNHFSSIYETCTENIYSGEKFSLSINDNILEILKENWATVNVENLIQIQELYEKENNIKPNLSAQYDKFLDKLKEAIKDDNKDVISEISKHISKLQKAIKLRSLIGLNLRDKKVYFPFWFDFRGRLYYGSDLSPTFFPEIRFCLHNGLYSIEDLNKKVPVNISKIFKNLMPKVEEIEILKEKNHLSERIKIGILFILISIAENFKTKMGKKISLLEFIDKGIYVINNYNSIEVEYDKKIKILCLISIIKNVAIGVYKKDLIAKDATASVFQHMVKLLGNRENIESLELCNLKSTEHWFDTYQYIIEDFKKKINPTFLSKRELDDFFSRSLLKKTIMTEKYSCGRKRSYSYYSEELENYLKKSEYCLTEEKKKEIRKIFFKFYSFTAKNETVLPFSSKKIEDLMNNKEIIFLDNSKINLIYFKMRKKEEDGSINKIRYTKIIQIRTNEEDEKKFNQSKKANIIQSFDAYLVRVVIKDLLVLSIHDCFLIDWLNVGELVDLINTKMNEKFHNLEEKKDIYSIFIVI